MVGFFSWPAPVGKARVDGVASAGVGGGVDVDARTRGDGGGVEDLAETC